MNYIMSEGQTLLPRLRMREREIDIFGEKEKKQARTSELPERIKKNV